MKLIATLVRFALGAFGLICFFDGLVTLYSTYSLKLPNRTFILGIFHNQPWARVGLGLLCIAASLVIRSAAAWLISRQKKSEQ